MQKTGDLYGARMQSGGCQGPGGGEQRRATAHGCGLYFWAPENALVIPGHNPGKVLNTTELFTLTWLILCYVSFIPITKN